MTTRLNYTFDSAYQSALHSVFSNAFSLIALVVGVLVAVGGSTLATEPAIEPAPSLHPYHVTYTELTLNPKSGNFEVAICVWPTDLEKALGKQEGMAVDIAKTPRLDKMMEKYVARRFQLQPVKSATQPPPALDATTSPKAKPTPATRLAGNEHSSSADSVKSSVPLSLPTTPSSDSNPQNSIETQPTPLKTSTKTKSEPPAGSKLRWVGHETEKRHVWLYFEIPGNAEQIHWTVENRMFTELNEDQLNHVQWSLDRKRFETFVCSAANLRHRISTRELLQGQRD